MEQRATTNNVHTPTTLMALFANAFRLDPEHNLLWVKGVYQDRRRQSYNGYYYDRLRDLQSGQIITLRLPAKIKGGLIPNETYIFKGMLEKDSRSDGVIEPVFVVAELVSYVRPITEEVRPDTLIQRKRENGFKPVDERLTQKLRRGIAPRLALICGVTSIVMDDVTTALGKALSQYQIHEQRIDIVSQAPIVTALQELDALAYDAIAIVRGGGPGLEVFDSITVARTALALKTPLITAIGHAQDVTLLEQIADKRLATPTALGTYLLKMTEMPTTELPVQEDKPSQKQISYKDIIIIVLFLIILYLIFSQIM